MNSDPPITAARARQVLRVGILASPGDLRRAFREAAKAAHPDRSGGQTERFREVVAAFHRLNRRLHERIVQPPVARSPMAQPPMARPEAPGVLTISPHIAAQGGDVLQTLPDGRNLRIRLPAGLRAGDAVRAGGVVLTVAIAGEPAMLVRGHDLWFTVPVDPRILAQGGRIALETPLGRRIVWVTRGAAERGLVRVVGQGLPARGRHPRGCLFIRLAEARSSTDSAARALLRRFTAAWAA